MTTPAPLPFVLNHITAPNLSWRECLALASRLGCTGVEFRNDLARPLFDGEGPEVVAEAARAHGLTPLARVLGGATAGVPPRIMGIGPAPATQKVAGGVCCA